MDFFKLTPKPIILFFSLLMTFDLASQCPGANTPDCTSGDPYFGVVINEFGGDGGNIDSRNDAIVELAGPAGTNIGGMVVSNGEWAVVIPAGTLIPADGVFLIACGSSMEDSAYEPVSGLTCSVCDFEGMPIDFDVCLPANAAFVSASITTYGFTMDNGYCGVSNDGDQLILFQPDGTVQDAVYYGDADTTPGGLMTIGGSSGNCGSPNDHISVQDGMSYTLGDNDNNGVINDYTGTHIGRRGDGGNAIGVNIMPTGNGSAVVFGATVAGGTNNAHQVCYTMPGLNDTRWIKAGRPPVGCNSTYVRLLNTDGSQEIVSSILRYIEHTTSNSLDLMVSIRGTMEILRS